MKRGLILLLLLTGCSSEPAFTGPVVQISETRFPEAAVTVWDAQGEGYSEICTIERSKSSYRRSDALNGHRIEEGYNRMQYPFATCAEGGEGAYVYTVSKKESRSFGAWWGSQIRDLPDGTIIKVEVVE